MSPEVTRRTLLQIIGEQLIPLTTRREQPSILLMEPELLMRTRPNVTLHQGEPLEMGKRMRSPYLLQHWPEQAVHAARYPCLLAVVDGEIDWRIGLLRRGEKGQAQQSEGDYLVVPIQRGTFFLTSSGVPYSDGQGVHWERPVPREGQATVFWMLLLPSGVLCHFCRSLGEEHRSHRQFFLPCPQISELARMLEKELACAESPDRDALTRAHLQAILIYARRSLDQQVKLPAVHPDSQQSSAPEPQSMARDAVQRARAYIEANLREPLTPESVATHAYLSLRQLERYFQRDVGSSISQYIIHRRMDAARVLLQDSDMLIRQVGEMVGYKNQSSFTQIFKRYTGMSPFDCRRKRGDRSE